MKKVCLDLSTCRGLGDTIASTPSIKKICEAYEKKISVITNFPELFEGNSLIEEIFTTDSIKIKKLERDYEILKSFFPNGRNSGNNTMKHNLIDLRQFHANCLGFSLLPDEMDMSYTPNSFVPIENLPERYVLIHPVQSWASRTWDIKKWQSLIDSLNREGIAVVSVGKDSSETGFFFTDKPVFNLKIELGLNLVNKTNISQTWWLIEKSICFVTMDSGLLHLAGTTDAQILQLGSSLDYRLRAPYRYGSQDYKYKYVGGTCNISCASLMKYGVKEWKTINGVPPLIGCLENKPTFECHPSYESVLDEVLKFTQNKVKFDTPKIRLVHLLLEDDLDLKRQEKSINNLKQLSEHNIEYIQVWNKRWTDDDNMQTWTYYVQHGRTSIKKAYYGNFSSFKNGIKDYFSDDLDALIVCEGDAYFVEDLEKSLIKIYEAYFSCENYKIDYFNLGDRFNIENGYPESISLNQIDDIHLVDKCIGAQMVMFPKRIKDYLFHVLDNSTWNTADLFFNENFSNTHNIGMFENPVCLQYDGLSSIDDVEKKYRKMETKKYNDRIELFSDILKNIPNGVGVEVGCFKGEFTKSLLQIWDGTIYMIDPWRELGTEYNDMSNHKHYEQNIMVQATQNVSEFEDRAIMIRCTSEVGHKLFQDESLDFVYIDANHAYEFVKQDIEMWFPKVKKGGYICGHDYLDIDWYNDPMFAKNGKDKHIWSEGKHIGIFGVNPAVDEFCKVNNYDKIITTDFCASWLIQK